MQTKKSKKISNSHVLCLLLFCVLGLTLWSFAGQSSGKAGRFLVGAGESTKIALPQLDLQKPEKTEIALFALG